MLFTTIFAIPMYAFGNGKSDETIRLEALLREQTTIWNQNKRKH